MSLFSEYFRQRQDTTCFPTAVFNCMIHQGYAVSADTLNKAIKVAKCKHGNTIDPSGVVKTFKAPLTTTKSFWQVFTDGGIIHILHPVFNGHSFYVHPNEDGKRLVCVNSWLGPFEMEVEAAQIIPFIKENFGDFWRVIHGPKS